MEKVIMYYLCLAVANLCFCFTGVAQDDGIIKVISFRRSNGIMLRWAPSLPVLWQVGNRFGYVVDRFQVTTSGDLSAPIRMTLQPLKPLSSQDMLSLAENELEVGALHEILYSKEDFQLTDDVYAAMAAHEQLETRFGLALLLCDQSSPAARSAGLSFFDQLAKPGERYVYRVQLAHIPHSFRYQPGVVVVDETEDKLPLVQDVHAKSAAGAILLDWPTFQYDGLYSAFHIQRSADGKNFKTITKSPFTQISEPKDSEKRFYFRDSLEANFGVQHYRIIGISPFGEQGPPSLVVKARSLPDLTGTLLLRESKKIGPNDNFVDRKVELHWSFPDDLNFLIEGFRLMKAPDPQGPYKAAVNSLLKPESRSVLDVTKYHNTYYIVQGIDTNDDVLVESFPFHVQFEDSIPPATPSGLTAKIDDLGVISLSWRPVTDEDLAGYRVYKKLPNSDEYYEVTRSICRDTWFLDSLKLPVLDKKVYYSVSSIDKLYNTSGHSAVYALTLPDKVPPSAPSFNRVHKENNGIILEWNNSSSEDVFQTALYRVSSPMDEVLIKHWRGLSDTSFVDVPPKPGIKYRYRLVATDSAGNQRTALSPELLWETGVRTGVTELSCTIDREYRQVILKWEPVKDARSCMLFRRENESTFILLRTLSPDTGVFIDRGITINNRYEYKMMHAFPNGNRSKFSKVVAISY